MKFLASTTATVAILAMAGFVAAPAVAGGLDEPYVEPTVFTPAPTAGTSWTGGYVGAQLAYGNTNSNTGLDDNDDGDEDFLDDLEDFFGDNLFGDDDDPLSTSGAVYGVKAGYLYDLGTFVVGAELALNATNIDFDSNLGSVDGLHTMKLKAGYDAGRTLIFGTLGAAYIDGDLGGSSFDDFGATVGIGVDYLVTDSIVVGGEISYHQFNSIEDTDIDLDVTTIGLNVNYKF